MNSKSTDTHKKALALFERALSEPSLNRPQWIKENAGGNLSVQEIALGLLHTDKHSNSALNTGSVIDDTNEDVPMPSQIGAYKIIERIGQGGMGAVYLGERESGDFDHRVAIKVIRLASRSDTLIQRFTLERQTLASLSHPNIARLYDGGTLNNSSPYMVMEYIEGKPITQWIQENKSSKKDILALYNNACLAVSYAHQNLVVHRDITPSNVLVDNTEQVKLIDFGISKPVDEGADVDNEDSSLASLSFTPGFAAPERLAGNHVTTLSDIYSLGKLLEELVCLSDQQTDDELNAIVAKSTCADPNSRYRSVDALIKDLNRYSTYLPLEAIGNKKTYRLGKFIKRHKAGVSFFAISLLCISSAFAITFVQYQQAELARDEAQKRFNDVRSLASEMMNEVYDKVYRVPGTTDASLALINAAQRYLDELAAETNAPKDVKLEAAVGFRKLGAMIAGAKLGSQQDLQSADAFFSKSEQIFRNIVDNDPDYIEAKTEFGKLYYYMAEVSIQPRRQYELALKQLSTSIGILRDASSLDNTQLAPKLALLYSVCYQGEVNISLGNLTNAVDIYKNCLRQSASMVKQYPDNEAILRLQSAAGRTYASALAGLEKFDRAVIVLNQAIADLDAVERLVDSQNDAYMLRDRTMAYWRRAYAHVNLQAFQKGLDDYQKALAFTNMRLEKDPKDANATWFYYTIEAEKATPLLHLGKVKEAEEGLLLALKWYQERVDSQPENMSRLGNLFYHYNAMAQFYKELEDNTKQCDAYANTLGVYLKISALAKPSNFEQQSIEAMKNDASHCNLDLTL